MAKKVAETRLIDVTVERQDESKNYTKFGKLAQVAALGNKPEILTGNDGTVFVGKQLAGGAKKLRIIVEVVE